MLPSRPDKGVPRCGPMGRTSRLRREAVLPRRAPETSHGAGAHLAHAADEHFAGLGAVGRAHHALALHALDHPRRAVVADAHLALEHGDGDGLHLADGGERLIVQLVGQVVLLAAAALAVLLARLEDGLVVDGLAPGLE